MMVEPNQLSSISLRPFPLRIPWRGSFSKETCLDMNTYFSKIGVTVAPMERLLPWVTGEDGNESQHHHPLSNDLGVLIGKDGSIRAKLKMRSRRTANP